MNCRYCGKELGKKHIQIGPKKLELNYCSVKCNVFDNLRKYPETSLVGMLNTMYPEIVQEYELNNKG